MLILAGVLGDGVGTLGAVLDALAAETVGIGDSALFSVALTAAALKRPVGVELLKNGLANQPTLL